MPRADHRAIHERADIQRRAVTVLGILCIAATQGRGQGSDSALAHLSFAVLYDLNVYGQDSASRSQLGELATNGRFRTDRLIVSGMIPVPHGWRYLASADYNGLEHDGKRGISLNDLAIIIPIGATTMLDIGRQKEGVTEQMMSSTRILPLTERSAPLTAFIPSRDDGVRAYGSDAGFGHWSLGWFNPNITAERAMNADANLFSGRDFVTSANAQNDSSVLQLGGTIRWMWAPDGQLRFHTKPENNEAPDVVDTGPFAANGAAIFGLDALAQRGGASIVMEGLLTRATGTNPSPATFGGFYTELSWRPGGETRAYDAVNGTLGRVTMRDGRNAWEIGARFSHTDLSSRAADGGVFDRASAELGWYGPRSTRLELDYGYGVLNRSGVTGHTQFLTFRLQREWL